MTRRKSGFMKAIAAFSLISLLVISLPVFALAAKGYPEYSQDEHRDLALDAVTEGIVLLKNKDNALPLRSTDKVALFGGGQIFNASISSGYQIGGGGSGWVNLSTVYPKGPADALLEASRAGKIDIYEPLTEAYRNDVSYVPDETMYNNAASYADTAIMFITRFSSEDADINIADWSLSDAELTMMKILSSKFDKVVVILNTPSVVSTDWSLDNNSYGVDVDALLACYMGGENGADGIRQILLGEANPSGKLVHTYAKDIYDYPTTETFLENDSYVNYTEDIYAGYRYFETFAKDKVAYPFGYGLSYTNFQISTDSFTYDDNKITLKVNVKNTGNVAGKEVVQVYYSAPQADTGSAVLSKSAIDLLDYAKTTLLQPNQSQTITFTLDIYDMASFDDTGKTGNKSCYVLEAGDYEIKVGNSVRDISSAGTYNVSELEVISQLSALLPTTLEERLTYDGTYESLDTSFNVKEPLNVLTEIGSENGDTESESNGGIEIDLNADNYKGITYADVEAGRATLEELIAQMSYSELIGLCYGHSTGLIGGTGTIGFAANSSIEKYGVYSADTTDGPAGLRLSAAAAISTFWPCATLQASTWNNDLLEEIGKAVGDECLKYNADIWLAPGLNIQRNPLCGRNFEYYSEDPVVSGKSACAVTNGVESRGVACAIKHFAGNNKETNRKFSDSRISERALREIYLKGFKIVVENADPMCIMTSYNLINGTYTSTSSDLIRGILRGEWGYGGLIISDWDSSPSVTDEVVAGNNVTMPTGEHEELALAVRNGTLSREMLEENAKYIIGVLVQLPDHTMHQNRVNEIADNKMTVVNVGNFSRRSYTNRLEISKGGFYAGYNEYMDTEGNLGYIEFKVSIKTAGIYSLYVDYATIYDATDAYDIIVNGKTVENLNNSVVTTAAWDNFARKWIGEVYFSEEIYTVRIQHKNAQNLNYRSLVFDLLQAIPHTHEFSEWIAVNEDNHERKCECGEIEQSTHNWDEGTVTDGVDTYVCIDCNSHKVESHTHKFGEWSIVDGESHKRICKCGEIEQTVHNWDEGTVTDGVDTYVCTDCNSNKEEAHTHKYGEWSVVDGEVHKHSCKCGETEQTAHNWNEGTVADGIETYTCTDCNLQKREAHTHKFDVWTAVDGENHTRSCKCGATEQTSHNWNESTVSGGIETYICVDCNSHKEEIHTHKFGERIAVDENNHKHICKCGEIEQSAHNWGDATESDGSKAYMCADCNAMKIETPASSDRNAKIVIIIGICIGVVALGGGVTVAVLVVEKKKKQ